MAKWSPCRAAWLHFQPRDSGAAICCLSLCTPCDGLVTTSGCSRPFGGCQLGLATEHTDWKSAYHSHQHIKVNANFYLLIFICFSVLYLVMRAKEMIAVHAAWHLKTESFTYFVAFWLKQKKKQFPLLIKLNCFSRFWQAFGRSGITSPHWQMRNVQSISKSIVFAFCGVGVWHSKRLLLQASVMSQF